MKKILLLPLFIILSYAQDIKINKELKCLAQNIYFEARNSNLADKFAVADVVINRVNSKSFPNTICKVVHQGRYWKGYVVRNHCAFSWYCDGKSDVPKDRDAWEEAKLIAVQIYNYGKFRGITEGSLYYHAYYVNPLWAKDYQLIGTIGKHKYYRLISHKEVLTK